MYEKESLMSHFVKICESWLYFRYRRTASFRILLSYTLKNGISAVYYLRSSVNKTWIVSVEGFQLMTYKV